MDKRPRVRDCRTPSLQRARWMLGGKMQSIWLGVCSASLLIIRKHHEMPENLDSELRFGGWDFLCSVMAAETCQECLSSASHT